MSNLVKFEQAIATTEMLEELNQLFEKIKNHHKKVSKKRTPKKVIKQKAGYDYVEDSYMRQIANEEYPGWSFEIVSSEIVGSISVPKSMFFKVHGRLKWIDNGVPRVGDMITAHRIQFKRDAHGYPTDEIVDMGNDFKAAVTDCMKKAFNTYLNIADDVYKKEEYEELTNKEKDYLLNLANSVGKEAYDRVKSALEKGAIDKSNYQKTIDFLKRGMK